MYSLFFFLLLGVTQAANCGWSQTLDDWCWNGCPSNTRGECADFLGWNCACKDPYYSCNGDSACCLCPGWCDSDNDCPTGQSCNYAHGSHGECIWQPGFCGADSDCDSAQHCDTSGSLGECSYNDGFCGTNADCSGGTFCKFGDPNHAGGTCTGDCTHGVCTSCPDNQNQFCQVIGLTAQRDFNECVDRCGVSSSQCSCLETWTEPTDGGNCGSTQVGCPSVNCQNGEVEAFRWCKVAEYGCAQSSQLPVSGEWMYCDDNTAITGCNSQTSCLSGNFCNFAANGPAGQYGSCISCDSIGTDCFNSGLAQLQPLDGVDECLHTCHACSQSDMTCGPDSFCHLDRTTTGFCDTCESTPLCDLVTGADSQLACQQKCECTSATSSCTSSSDYCEFFSDSTGMCRQCPASISDCHDLPLASARYECEIDCFPCSAFSQCDEANDFFCNFDLFCNSDPSMQYYAGVCIDCDSISDCTASGLNNIGEQECRDICKKFPTNLPSSSPTVSPFSGSPSIAPSVDCSQIEKETSCRVKGCAWIPESGLCLQECTKQPGIKTIGEVLGSVVVLESIAKCEESCLLSGLGCERFNWNRLTSECTKFYTYAEESSVSDFTTGICLHTFQPTPCPTKSPSAQPSGSPSPRPSVSQPSVNPVSSSPSGGPTNAPSRHPTFAMPTSHPVSSSPSISPSRLPSVRPSAAPSTSPISSLPSEAPIGANIQEKECTFSGNFEVVIGSNAGLFLQECNDYFLSVECRSVRSGSIILLLRGPQPELDNAVRGIVENGLQLPSWPTFLVTDDFAQGWTETSEDSESFLEKFSFHLYIAAAVIFCLSFTFCVLRCQSKEKFVEVIDLAQVYAPGEQMKMEGHTPYQGEGHGVQKIEMSEAPMMGDAFVTKGYDPVLEFLARGSPSEGEHRRQVEKVESELYRMNSNGSVSEGERSTARRRNTEGRSEITSQLVHEDRESPEEFRIEIDGESDVCGTKEKVEHNKRMPDASKLQLQEMYSEESTTEWELYNSEGTESRMIPSAGGTTLETWQRKKYFFGHI